MKKILDFYFRFPVIIDFVIAFLVVLTTRHFTKRGTLTIPDKEQILDYASETTTVLLTLAGFILTFLTVLVTFKVGNSTLPTKPTVMEAFCNSSLYKETTRQLKNCIKSLIFLTMVIYMLRFINILGLWITYYWVILSIIVLLLTIMRSLFILDNILKFHTEDTKPVD